MNLCRLRILIVSIAVIGSSLFSLPGYTQDLDSKNFDLNDKGIMLNGYDVVSYFMGSVTKGKSSIMADWQGIMFWFSSDENKAIFLKSPEKFIPAYGGWCAYAMGDSGEKIRVDPKTYKIVNGKLYLFYNFYFNNTLIDWNENEKSLMQKADSNWALINQ